MRSELTADEYRIAAKVMREVFGDPAHADAIVFEKYAAQVDAVEADRAYVAKLAEDYLDTLWSLGDAPTNWNNLPDVSRRSIMSGIQAVLATLELDGRLKPSTVAWETWLDVPEGVLFKSAGQSPIVFRREGDVLYNLGTHARRAHEPIAVQCSVLKDDGPFVRAEA